MKQRLAPLAAAIAAAGSLVGALHAQAPASADASTQAPAVAPAPPGWTLSFDDEFSSTSVDLSRWYVGDRPNQIDNTVGYYRPENVTVQDGFLRLRSAKQDYRTYHYTSGTVGTNASFNFLYGRVEMRARLPHTAGSRINNEFYTVSDSWPPSIDFMQFFGQSPHHLQMTNFYEDIDRNTGSHTHDWTDPTFDSTQWHRYAVEWTPGSLRWFVDGQLRASETKDVPTEPMALNLCSLVGGDWGGNPAQGTWPQDQDIDYVRIYRRAADPPPVQAGGDQITALPDAKVKLAGISSNPLGSVTVAWTTDSGPGPVTFDTAQGLTTTAHFTKPGSYTLRLTAKDGATSNSDTLTVLVDPPKQTLLPANADTDIGYWSNNPKEATSNWGSTHSLWVTTPPATDHMSGPLNTNWTLIRFDLTHLSSVGHATLRLCGGIQHGGEKDPTVCDVFAVSDNTWDENAVTWFKKPKIGAKVGTFTVSPYLYHNQDRWHEVDLTDYVRAQKAAGQNLLSLAILAEAAPHQHLLLFHSREAGSEQPELIITPP